MSKNDDYVIALTNEPDVTIKNASTELLLDFLMQTDYEILECLNEETDCEEVKEAIHAQLAERGIDLGSLCK